MLKEAFCVNCVRTVYRGVDDEDSCPVCSSSLIVTTTPRDVGVAAAEPSEIIPENGTLRMAAVGRYEILDTPRDGAFDRITDLAARVFDVPIATINIIDTEPRELGEKEIGTLQCLAEVVVDNLELRLAALRLFRDFEEQGSKLSA